MHPASPNQHITGDVTPPSRFSLDIDDAALRAGLARMAQRSGALPPALRQIGELLIAPTKARFQTGIAPDGQCWAPNSRATIERGFANISRDRKGYLDGFQSAPGFSAGRYYSWSAGDLIAGLFQSAPGFAAGRCPSTSVLFRAPARFNPRPALQPGDAVSGGMVQRAHWRFNPRPALQPGDAPVAVTFLLAPDCFNPRPALQPGDAYRRAQRRRPCRCFNPRPALQPGDAILRLATDSYGPVSIRARLCSRAMRQRRHRTPAS